MTEMLASQWSYAGAEKMKLAGILVILADFFLWALCYGSDENTAQEDEAQAAYLAQYARRKNEKKGRGRIKR